jgi:hypothetical protein
LNSSNLGKELQLQLQVTALSHAAETSSDLPKALPWMLVVHRIWIRKRLFVSGIFWCFNKR